MTRSLRFVLNHGSVILFVSTNRILSNHYTISSEKTEITKKNVVVTEGLLQNTLKTEIENFVNESEMSVIQLFRSVSQFTLMESNKFQTKNPLKFVRSGTLILILQFMWYTIFHLQPCN